MAELLQMNNPQVNTNKPPRVSRLKKIQINWIWNLFFLIGAAGFITMTTFYIQPGSFKSVLKLIHQQPLILLVNFLPPLIVIVLCYFIFNNVFYAGAVTSFIFNIASFINKVKIELRDDPFVPRDIQLLQEAGDSLANFELNLDYKLIFLIILAIVLFVLFGRIFKSKKMHISIRIGGMIASIVIAILANNYIYSSKVVYYHKLHTSNRSYITRVYTELGFTYCFLYNLNTYPVEKPENFSKEEVESWIKEYAAASTDAKEPTTKPHVIMIMNEAFSDIAKDDSFAYTEENDPLKYFKEISASENSISGHITVPGFGGGTANTEFDVLTGMQTDLLNSVSTSAFRVVGKNLRTVPRILTDNDYQTLFMHPGDSWFYNRSSVYKYFGINDQIFSEAFTKEDKKGNMVADSVLAQKLIEQFEERTGEEGSNPLFSYVVTIQNHMAYTVNKYGDLPIEEVPVNKEISQEAKDFLSVYMEGVKDADQMLKDLTNYFEAQDEPVVLVFFGDHLPNLGDNYLSYKELGLNIGNTETAEDVMDTYSTPFVIWSNQVAAEQLDFANKVKTLDLPEDNRISANFLGATLLELLGYEGQDEYFDFLNDLRREIPVIAKGYYQTPEEGYTNELTEEQAMWYEKLRNWEYYKIKVENYRSK